MLELVKKNALVLGLVLLVASLGAQFMGMALLPGAILVSLVGLVGAWLLGHGVADKVPSLLPSLPHWAGWASWWLVLGLVVLSWGTLVPFVHWFLLGSVGLYGFVNRRLHSCC